MSIFHRRKKKKISKPKEQVPKSEVMAFIETNSTVAPNGKVTVISNGKKKVFDYFAPKPTPEILKSFVDMLKLPKVTDYFYE